MMYLVLTALLALNVSKEVLNSFFEVNLGIVKTTTGLDKKNNDTYDAFEDATNQEKVKNYKNLANQVKPISSELVEDIQKMKYKLVLKTDGKVFLGQHKDEEGDEIESGTPICVLEAMKMENNVMAEKSGILKKVLISKGDSVGAGDVLAIIE